ncbi:MAG: FAD-linked oxidase C-terminal domain-containing protein [Planctomycetota bacterium]
MSTTEPPSAEPAPEHDLEAVARGLASAVTGEVRFGRLERMLYATDASIYQEEPLGVVIPDSIDDVVRTVVYCREHGLPILPRGGGTSLAGQCTSRAVVIDVSAHCRGVLDVDAGGRRCRVEPGITIADLNTELAPDGLHFAPDPSTTRQANVGGCIGNNAAGSRSIKYGRTAENLLGVDVCLVDGRRLRFDEGAALRDPEVAAITAQVAGIVRTSEALIRERFPKTLRRNAGYALDMILHQLDAGDGDFSKVNLAHLMCGSEGTLAVTTGAELLLHPVPKAVGLAVVAFDSLDGAMDALMPLLDLKPSAVELLDDLVVGLARQNLEHRKSLELLPRPERGETDAVLYVEFQEQDAGVVRARLEEVCALHGSAVATSTDAGEMGRLWRLRIAGEPLLHGVPGERKPLGFVEDNVVPPERLAEFVRRFREVVEREGTRAAFYAHASVGVLHVRPLLTLRDAGDRAAMERIAAGAASLAKELGGVMSGEHGDGKARGPLLDDFYGPELMRAFAEVKAIFDPQNLLNPGNIVAPRAIETIHEGTRVHPTAAGAEIGAHETYFDYADQTDFAHAVEMCNGAGVCRKKTGGAMCPSYMASRDEAMSTRGYGNTLRLAISGQLSPGRYDDPEVHAALSMCLSCKSCKAECPSNVDVSRLKAEYEAQSWKARGRAPLQKRVFGRVHALNKLASIAPGVTNFFNSFGPSRAVLNSVLGLHPERSLPRFETPLHKRWGGDDPALPSDAPVVALYGDTFTTHNEPGIGLASKRLLEAFGYRVRLVHGTDAGRALISTGMLPEVIAQTETELDGLKSVVVDDAVEAVLFCEPSVLSAVTDDWLQLKIDRPIELRRRLAAKSALVETFLDRRWDTHPRRPEFRTEGIGEILLHAHCHQKALWGAETSAGLLGRVWPGCVRTLDTTCCGMAGSYGYTRERFGLSQKIGELGVLPAARGAGEGTVFVAPGTSCRHQVLDGAGGGAVHPVVLVWEAAIS